MASCLVPDFPAVLLALEHLGELEKQLKDEDVSFSQEASHHLREISTAIRELEASRKAVHEQLEVETIESGKVRHQVLRFRDDITKEIADGVATARNVNSTQLNQLEAELKSLMEEIESMEVKQGLLEEQNALLYPERECVKRNHENVISMLNFQLAEKANKQILLNEKINEIEDIKAKIASVELNRGELLSDITQERDKFTEAKNDWEEQIEQYINSIQQQKKNNSLMHRELDALSTELQEKEDRNVDLRNTIYQIEMTIARLTATEKKFKNQLAEETSKSEELEQQRVFHKKELAELRTAFRKKEESLQQSILETDTEITEYELLTSVHLASITRLTDHFNIQRKLEDDTMAEHTAMARRLEWSKLRLDERIASIAKYKLEIREMEQGIRQLHETTVVNTDLFKRNLEEMEVQLAKEKKTRAAFENEREELHQSLEDLNVAHEEHMNKVNEAIENTKEQSHQLQEEEKKLQDHVFMSSLIESLKKMVAETAESTKEMEIACIAEIKQFEEETEALTKHRLELEELLEIEQSILSGVEGEFDIDQARHQTLTKETTDLKFKKMQLELCIQDTQDDTVAMLRPKEELKLELVDLRRKHLEILKSQAEQISQTERVIYENGVMLEQVNRENCRLHVCIEQMKEDVFNANQGKVRHTQETEWLREEVGSLFKSLLDAWDNDIVVTKESNEKDLQNYKAFQNLLMKLENRKYHIGSVIDKMTKEFETLTVLLSPQKLL
ncbi:coiled-coil domain-containing protein 175 [Alosa sapidissima]|uniref:coiled-coil domain-containing protein 175 n=1 Tax=Alosa sapidissima TaxID=34773 RepID=UPI001C09714B|nr:coiled-coil domain-containing protein 175 [Alosa sapidissima]